MDNNILFILNKDKITKITFKMFQYKQNIL